jgi:uncharacterized SAM-binding protein YcdF (DUF218 family)
MQALPRLYDWLAISDAPQTCDLIFVLAGREGRKHFGLQMFAEGWASTLLLSVGRFEIRRFVDYKLPGTDLVALASSIPPQRRHFFVAAQGTDVQAELIQWHQLGTWREIRALAEWLRRHKAIQTLMIISSGFHLRRVRWCCRKLLPKDITTSFLAVPSELPSFERSQWWRNATSRNMVLMEVTKVVLYPFVCMGQELA